MSSLLVSSLLTVSSAFCAVRGLSQSRVSTIVLNDGKVLTRLAAGGDLTTRSYEKAMAWFSANWPAGLDWPEGIERPVVAAPDHLPDAGTMVPATDEVAA